MAKAKKTAKRASSKKKQLSLLQKTKVWLAQSWQHINARRKNFLARRPHRSFRRTRRRDYTRSLTMPGYIAFTAEVTRTLRAHWKLFLLLALTYALVMVALGAITSQELYTSVNQTVSDASHELFDGGIGKLGEAAFVALAAFGSSGTELSADQGVYLSFSVLFVWLATIWLLRELLAGRKPRLRDGLYNSGAPILSTVGVVIVLAVQLVPVGVATLLYYGLSQAQMLHEGFGAMLFGIFAATIAALVLYWISSTILALVVVTIPGMYPLHALRIAGDLVVGRRLRVFLRLLWGLLAAALIWSLALLVVVLIDNVVKTSFPDAPAFSLAPYIAAAISAMIAVWFAAYVYLFYRKVVDDDAKPA